MKISPKDQQALPVSLTTIGKISTSQKAVIAIDFGTARSGVAWVFRDNPTLVNYGAPGAKNSRNEAKVPTVLFKDQHDKWYFGNDAITRYRESLDKDDDVAFSRDSAECKVAFFRHFKMKRKNRSSGVAFSRDSAECKVA